MSASARLKVVLCWHMHQPQYTDLVSGEHQLPWTYLHAIKDYVDMAAHLEALPAARAVVNFSPVLLEQIDDYATQVHGFLANSLAIRDPLLAALANPALPAALEQRVSLLRACLRANEKRMIDRFPAYRRIADMATWLIKHQDVMPYIADQFLADLLVWYHLAWMGETLRRRDIRLRRLIAKGDGYTLHERRELMAVIDEQLSGLIGRYAALARSGQIELSVTPYAHPILPLLLDFQSARQALPEVALPHLPGYPGGAQRAAWQVRTAIDTFERHFGLHPVGCWPAEGGVSEASVHLLEEFGFSWAASGGKVLVHSLAAAGPQAPAPTAPIDVRLYRDYRLPDSRLSCFFRDDGLSDLLSFTYADWHADDAVANLIGHLEGIAAACKGQEGSVVSIIMDGENAWEYYPENAYHFLSALYQRLSSHPALELTTFSACLQGQTAHAGIPQLVAGSWVYGTFSTWIGEPDKNRAWDMLGDAKRVFDAAVAGGRLSGEALTRAERQLAICEASDWFWWFGDINPAATVSDFDRLYRQHLANLYQMCGEEPPQYLSQPFSHGGGAPLLGGVMRPGHSG
jgi:alpha-amylase/alpha-mannosidase (GH57 family)